MKWYKPLILIMLVSFAGCNKSTPMPECNPEGGRFIQGKHYIAADMLTEDNTWNLIELQKYNNRRENMYPDSNCIPITAEETFEDSLSKKIEDIESQRKISH